jgi:hypothetical protein
MPLKELFFTEKDSMVYPNSTEKTVVHKFEGFESSEEAFKLYSAFCKLNLTATIETSFNEATVNLYVVFPKTN